MIEFIKKYHLICAMLFMLGGAVYFDNVYGVFASFIALLNAMIISGYQSFVTKSHVLHQESVRILDEQNKLLEELNEENQQLHDAALRK